MPPQTTTLFSVSILFFNKINGNIHSNEQNLLCRYKTTIQTHFSSKWGKRNIMYTNKVDVINTYYNTTITIIHTGRSHTMPLLLTMFVPQKSFGICMIYSSYPEIPSE